MGNLLERITLYDILGYALPGCVLLLLLLLGIDAKCISAFYCKWKDNIGALYFIFFLAAYLSGIILSELTDTIVAIRIKLKPLAAAKWEQDDCLREQVARALKKSGYNEGAERIVDVIEREGMSRYMGYMYGFVQVSTEYKRIHDYASAYVLYKNLAMVFAIGTGFLFIRKGWDFEILILGVVLTVLMVKRSIRFYHIRNKYAVVWFLNKYLCNNQNAS